MTIETQCEFVTPRKGGYSCCVLERSHKGPHLTSDDEALISRGREWFTMASYTKRIIWAETEDEPIC